jgi:hypothetical protein
MHVHSTLALSQHRDARRIVTRPSTRHRFLNSQFSLPAVSGPIGGGLIKLGHGGTWAAVTVGVAPYAYCTVLCTVFAVGYLGTLFRYLCTGPSGQQAMERLITVSASAIVSMLTWRD